MIEIVSFARAFPDSGEDRNAAVAFRDVVDQFHDDHGLAHACASERADFAALRKRTDQIDDFNSGFENLDLRVLFHELRSRPMDRVTFRILDGPAIIYRITGDIEDATENSFTNRDGNRPAGIGDAHPALQPFGRRHRD